MNRTLHENIDWVGHVDWSTRDFHGYVTDRGVTYNAYLIQDEHTALIDTVKGPFADSLIGSVAALTDLERVRYVVCNHAEPDHAGGLSRVMQALPNATLVCNKRCATALAGSDKVSACPLHTSCHLLEVNELSQISQYSED